MTEAQNEPVPDRMWVVQKDYPFEGYENVAVCLSEEIGLELVRELNAMSTTRHILEPVPLVVDVESALVEVLTLSQEIFHGGVIGDYKETHERKWSFQVGDTSVKMLGTQTAIVVSVSGKDHRDVREQFVTAKKHGLERATRDQQAPR